MANNPYLTVRSEYFTSISTSGLPTFLISVKNMNLLSSSIYKHLKRNSDEFSKFRVVELSQSFQYCVFYNTSITSIAG